MRVWDDARARALRHRRGASFATRPSAGTRDPSSRAAAPRGAESTISDRRKAPVLTKKDCENLPACRLSAWDAARHAHLNRSLREGDGWPGNGKKLPLNLLCPCLPDSRQLLRSRPPSRARPRPVTANLSRRPPCRDDLVRRPASELRHMVEFEDKRPYPGRG